MDFLTYKDEMRKKYVKYNKESPVNISTPSDEHLLIMYLSYMTLYEMEQKHQNQMDEQYYNERHMEDIRNGQ